MKTVKTEEAFKDMFDENGVPTEPFTCIEGLFVDHLGFVTSLDGLVGTKNMRLFDLKNLKTLDGFLGAKNMQLSELMNIKTLGRFEGVENMQLFGLDNCEVKAINPTKKEIEILKRIPLDRVDMSDWHCGTSHCLAGWAEVIVDEVETRDAFEAGLKYLPSMKYFFYSPDSLVIDYLRTLHK